MPSQGSSSHSNLHGNGIGLLLARSSHSSLEQWYQKVKESSLCDTKYSNIDNKLMLHLMQGKIQGIHSEITGGAL